MKSAYWKGCIGLAFLLSLMLAFGCATTGAPLFAKKADNPGPMPVDSTWVQERRDSGSYGSGTARITQKSLGERTWQGQKVWAYESPTGTLLFELPSMKWMTILKGTTQLVSYEPPIGFDYPLWVGRDWKTTHRITNHGTGKTTTVETRWNVEALEEITVPAGKFKVYRVTNTDPGNVSTHWWSPELGIFIKSKQQRNTEHAMGPGVREMELISYDIKK